MPAGTFNASGLVRADVRSDPHGEYPDWPRAAREMIASRKPKFVVMMIGINDRKQIREAFRVAPLRAAKPSSQAGDPAHGARAIRAHLSPRPCGDSVFAGLRKVQPPQSCCAKSFAIRGSTFRIERRGGCKRAKSLLEVRLRRKGPVVNGARNV
jgi:hypothetical protein